MKKLLILFFLAIFVCVGCALKDPGSQYDLAPSPGFRMVDKDEKATLVAGDFFLIEDSEDGNDTKHTTMDNIDTYLAAIYQPLTAYLTDLGDGNITSNFVNETYPWADNEVANAQTITAQAGSTWDIADSVTALSVYTGTTSLDESSNATDSGAYIVKCFDEFANSTGNDTQTVLDDLDAALDLRCLESVFGTSIGAGLLKDGAVLKASVILQKYHGVDPSADVLTMLGSTNDTAILNNIGDGIVTLADTTLADTDYLWFHDNDDNGTTKRVDADEIRNVPASTTLAGEIELATSGEMDTGNATDRASTPDALAGSILGQKDIGWTICDSDTNSTIADGKKGYAYPYATDMEIYEVVCAVDDLNSAASGTTTVMLRRVHNGSDNDTLSVGVTIDYDEYSAHDATIDTNKDDLTKGDLLYFDVDAVTSPPHKGLSCTVIVHRP